MCAICQHRSRADDETDRRRDREERAKAGPVDQKTETSAFKIIRFVLLCAKIRVLQTEIA